MICQITILVKNGTNYSELDQVTTPQCEKSTNNAKRRKTRTAEEKAYNKRGKTYSRY